MLCRYCKRDLPENALYCCWCGKEQRKPRKAAGEIKVPTPRQLPSGAWTIQLRAEGLSVTEPTRDKCIAKAKAIRAGILEQKKKAPRITVREAIDAYLRNNSNVLSPSTLRGYDVIARYRFLSVQDSPLADVDWQAAINAEALLVSPKTLRNSWELVRRVMEINDIPVPNVRLPQVVRKDQPWLTFEQIQQLLEAVKGKSCELAVLLALHGLRRSELLAITPASIYDDAIHVAGAIVPNTSGEMVRKETNKNASSQRVVPVVIPRLSEILADESLPRKEPLVTSLTANYNQINNICCKLGLPSVGLHGLRRSFASLAYHLGWPERVTMQLGGWSDWQTMHNIYIKLDKSDVDSAVGKMRSLYS